MSVTFRCDVCGRVSSEKSIINRSYGPNEKYSGLPLFIGDVCRACRERIDKAVKEEELSEIRRIQAEMSEGGDSA